MIRSFQAAPERPPAPGGNMRASRIVALSAFSLALCSTAAWADETVAAPATKASVTMGETPKPPAAKRGEYTLDTTIIHGRPARPNVAVDISRLIPRAPLSELRKPLVDRIGAAIEKDPF
jgi:hypothetical protein